MKPQQIAQVIMDLTNKAKTMGELHQMLNVISFTAGGMVCNFDSDERSQVLLGLTKALGDGFIKTSQDIGEPCDIEMVVAERSDRQVGHKK